MKNVFYFIAAALMASCSSDDDNKGKDNNHDGTTLAITASAPSVVLGNAVTFTVTNNLNETVTGDATIYVNGEEIAGSTYTAPEAGAYTAYARIGTTASPVITFVVQDPGSNQIVFGGTAYTTDKSTLYYVGSDTNQNLSYWIANMYLQTPDGFPNDVYLFFSTEQVSDTNIDMPGTGQYDFGNAGIKKMYNLQVFLDYEEAVKNRQAVKHGAMNIYGITGNVAGGAWVLDYGLTLHNGTEVEGSFAGEWDYTDWSGPDADSTPNRKVNAMPFGQIENNIARVLDMKKKKKM